ncbi:MAG: hypothetical protein HY265_06680 [Deltaproteobacteria bacterium]|nr:hypothetical protein [Deltaproteobacteria bacterium]MBI3755826.1 hypothetical protein [Deltaproteobacteria bacterium]
MENAKVILIYSLIFIAMLAVIFVSGRYLKKIPTHAAKRINQISFSLAIASGILLYILHKAVFMYLFLSFLVVFFMFFNYKDEG